MTENELTILIGKYLSGEATEEEKNQVEHWYESFDTFPVEFAEGNSKEINESLTSSLKTIQAKITQNRTGNMQKAHPLKPERKIFSWRHVAAAAIFVLISGTAYFMQHRKSDRPANITVLHPKNDIQPGGNKAILTLGNGMKIVLDSTDNGPLSMQGNTQIIKLNSGQLTYSKQPAVGQQAEVFYYNTITTPRGGQYEITLPDGSKVWLNAASSIRFPTAFTGKERDVQVTGEAYFEIAKNVSMPFKVLVNGVKIEVLGTHFNIMAYNDEATMKTTLLEGSVKITKGSDALILKPGQEAQVKQNNPPKLIRHVNTDAAIAWKNNLFWFDNNDIQSVMRQLARWYNVNITIEGNIPDRFTGSIPRDITFSRVFEVLQKTGSIHYRIENKKIIVSP